MYCRYCIFQEFQDFIQIQVCLAFNTKHKISNKSSFQTEQKIHSLNIWLIMNSQRFQINIIEERWIKNDLEMMFGVKFFLQKKIFFHGNIFKMIFYLLQNDISRKRSKLKISSEYYLFTIVFENIIRKKERERQKTKRKRREKKEREKKKKKKKNT